MSFQPATSEALNCQSYAVYWNSTTNATCEHDGPVVDFIRQSQFDKVLPSIVYTAVLMALGLPGNLAVIFVYLFKMDRTPSRRFFISLAVCDFLNCMFGMPIELTLLANFYNFDYPVLCSVSRFANYFLNNTSACLHIAIAFDRYKRVRHPLKPAMTLSCFKLICTIAVIFSFTSAIPALFIYGTRTFNIETPGGNGTHVLTKTCHVDDHALKPLRLGFSIYLLIATLLSFFVLLTLYALITRVLLKRRGFVGSGYTLPRLKSGKHRTFHNSGHHAQHTGTSASHIDAHQAHIQTDIIEPFRARTSSDMSGVVISGIKLRVGKTTFILFIVTLVFVLSFIPHLVIVNLRYTKPNAFTKLSPLGWKLFHVALRSYLLNSSINPIIYCFLNKDFRCKLLMTLKDAFFVCCRRGD